MGIVGSGSPPFTYPLYGGMRRVSILSIPGVLPPDEVVTFLIARALPTPFPPAIPTIVGIRQTHL